MATVTARLAKPVQPPIEKVFIELSLEEAIILKSILSRIYGNGKAREFSYSLYEDLRNMDIPSADSLFFDNDKMTSRNIDF